MYVAVFFSHSLPSLDLSVSLRLLASASSLSFLGYVIVNCSSDMLCSLRHSVLLLTSFDHFPSRHRGCVIRNFAVTDHWIVLFISGTGISPATTRDPLIGPRQSHVVVVPTSIHLEHGDQNGHLNQRQLFNFSFVNPLAAS